MKPFSLLFVAFCLVSQLSFAQIAACPLSDPEKEFLENAIGNFVLDSIYTAGFSGVFPGGFPTKAHFAYSSTLLGPIRSQGVTQDAGIRESSSLPELCTEPKIFEATCRSQSPDPLEDRFWKEHDVCVQISCEAKDLYKAEILWSVRDDADARFRYTATEKREIEYEPHPSLVWRLNDRSPGRLIVTGDLLSSARITLKDGKRLRAFYTGSVTAVTKPDIGLFSFVLNMTFPGFKSLIPVRADLLLHRHDDASANGSILLGENKLATLTLLPAEPLKIVWEGSCGN